MLYDPGNRSDTVPVVRSTKRVFDSLEDYEESLRDVWNYNADTALSANLTNQTVHALEEEISRLENGYATIAVQSGQAAITTALMTYLKNGRALMLPGSVYGPTALFAENQLGSLGIETYYYDPENPGDLTSRCPENCSLIHIESPSSLTFQLTDIEAVTTFARKHNITTVMDNSWSSSVGCQPLDHGVDVSLQSLTKTMNGHSDSFGGSITVNQEAHYKALKNTAVFLGHFLSPDDARQILRGMETLTMRLDRQMETASQLQRYLQGRPEISRILAAEQQDPVLYSYYHEKGAGLFTIEFCEDIDRKNLSCFYKALHNFKISTGWGGAESLILPVMAQGEGRNHMARIYVGHGDAGALIAGLERGFDHVKAAESKPGL